METHVKVLAVLYIFEGVAGLLLALGLTSPGVSAALPTIGITDQPENRYE